MNQVTPRTPSRLPLRLDSRDRWPSSNALDLTNMTPRADERFPRAMPDDPPISAPPFAPKLHATRPGSGNLRYENLESGRSWSSSSR